MKDLIKKHLDDLAAGNWNEYKAACANDISYEEIATRQRAHGVDEYVAIVKRWKTAFPDLRAKIKDISVAADRCVVELEWEGTHRGSLDVPFGSIPPTNKVARVSAALVMRVENGKIREEHNYFDLFSLMTQLGLAPTIPGVAAGTSKTAQATRQP